jgi:hypothetical protein
MGIRLSYTQNEKYQTSPRAWYLHYMLKLREEKTGSPLVFGNAIDNALNQLIANKFLTPSERQDPVEVFKQAWRTQTLNQEKVDLSKSDLIKYSKSDLDLYLLTDLDHKQIEKDRIRPEWLCLEKKGLMMLEAYEQQVLPHISDLIAVQKYFKIGNNDGDEIIGFIDLIAKFKVNDNVPHELDKYREYNNKTIIFDNKTTSIKYDDDSVKVSKQLGTYSEAPGVGNHDAEGFIAIPKKIRKQKEPKVPIQIIIDKVEQEVVDSVFESYMNTLNGIKLGKFECNGCEKAVFGCPYKTYCASNGTDLTGLVYSKEKE